MNKKVVAGIGIGFAVISCFVVTGSMRITSHRSWMPGAKFQRIPRTQDLKPKHKLTNEDFSLEAYRKWFDPEASRNSQIEWKILWSERCLARLIVEPACNPRIFAAEPPLIEISR
jgi:hypothetical protein